MGACVHTRGSTAVGGPGLTLLAPRARVAGLTRTQAADRIATPVAYNAAAGVAAVGSPVAAVAGCNATQVSPHRPGRTHEHPVSSSPPPHARPRAPGPHTSLAAEASPPGGTAATSGHRVAVPVIGTGAPHLAAGPKPARRACCRTRKRERWMGPPGLGSEVGGTWDSPSWQRLPV